MLKDINGKTIRKGSRVRRAARGSDVIPPRRRATLPVQIVLAVGRGKHLAGLVCVTTLSELGGARVWERPGNFERV